MKFTNVVVVSMLSIMLLNGCSMLSPVVEVKPVVTEATPESLTPLQAKAKALQTQPNLYKKQAGKHKVSARTLNQFQAALALHNQGELANAKAQLIALSEQHPNLSGIWLQLALVSKEQNQDNGEQMRVDMTRYLNNAITANSLNYLAHNELAMLLRQQGQFYQALEHYELALKSWPAFAPAYLNRAILYDLYMGKKSLALADYELYQTLSNDDSRQLKGWIIDLQRQIKNTQQNTPMGVM